MRSTLTTLFAIVTAAWAVAACEPAEPHACVPDLGDAGPDPAPNPECGACVEDHCGDAGDSCGDECRSYFDCTCDCADDDEACFAGCADGRSSECAACQEQSGNAVIACIMAECSEPCGGGGSGADDGASSTAGDDDGGGSSWTSAGDDGAADEGGAASCDELHSTCCPQLEGFDLQLCEDATDETSCAIWLDIFRDEGSC